MERIITIIIGTHFLLVLIAGLIVGSLLTLAASIPIYLLSRLIGSVILLWLLPSSDTGGGSKREFTLQKQIQVIIAKIIERFPTQLSVGGLESAREKDDRNIKVLGSKRSSVHRVARREGIPFDLLPNVKTFKISLRSLDFVFKLFGIDRKHKPEITITPLSSKTHQMNRYLVHQFLRMKNHEKKGEIGRILIKRSEAFRLVALRRVYPDWGRHQPLGQVLRLLKRARNLAMTEAHIIGYKRAYIPKSDGRLRPLGVPDPEGRLYLHQLQCITVWILKPTISTHQHAFLPGRGVLTAWKQIFAEVIDKANIYEFDLKGFFDNVDGVQIQLGLMAREVPVWIQEYYRKLNCSRPIIEEAKIPERTLERTRYETAYNEDAKLANMEYERELGGELKPWETPFVSGIRPQSHPAEEWFLHQPTEEGFTSEEDTLKGYGFQKPTEAEREHDERLLKEFNRGVPQGSSLSPILAILALESEVMPQVSVQYADDGLVASDEPRELELSSYIQGGGIERADHKSGFIKKDGKWLKPLKFLGMEYDGPTETFSASTRKGATLTFTGRENLLLRLEKELSKISPADPVLGRGSAEGMRISQDYQEMAEALVSKASWQSLIGSRYYGFFFSRMQMDSGNLKVSQDFSLHGEKLTSKSWLAERDTVDTELMELGTQWGEPVEWMNPQSRIWDKAVRSAGFRLRDWGVVKVNLFNASSYAYHDLARILRKRKKKS